MNNLTQDSSDTPSLFKKYFLGESPTNILLRLALIILFILLIWCILTIILIFYIRYQRKKHLQYFNESHHHPMYGSKLNLTNTNVKRRSPHHSSASFKRKSFSASVRKPPLANEKNKVSFNTNNTHAIITAMTKPPLSFRQKSILVTRLDPNERQVATEIKVPVENKHKTSNPPANHSSTKEVKLPVQPKFFFDDRTDQTFSKSPFQIFAIKIRRFPNTNLQTLPLRNSFLSNSISPNERVVHSHCLPTVMVTDTNASYTNIVEFETFEDEQGTRTDVEKRLARQLRAIYRVRHST
ncbi:unnamed protein product [Adineta ricciae]|uniref:Uncharacterized protein n=1 Tax=Adineta ricciae TaxID=249248 RepID=A0A813W685_ADIRI|nr:unnamed protein product [Adineta ricciae]